MHVQLSGVSKKFGATTALAGVSLDLRPGEIVAVIGLNGAGKTTLLSCLAGLLAPTRGTILFEGQPFKRDRLDVRRRLLFVPDQPVMFGDDTLIDHVASLLKIYERPTAGAERRIVELLREFDVLALAEAPLGTLSRGQFYKCGLVGLLAVAPELWLLDEPFASGMDPHGLAALRRHARAAADAGATIVYSTQILEVAQRFCDRLLVLNHGELAREFSATELSAADASGQLDSLLESFRERRA